MPMLLYMIEVLRKDKIRNECVSGRYEGQDDGTPAVGGLGMNKLELTWEQPGSDARLM